MLTTELETDRTVRAQLQKAENREKIAQCKLENLKNRFDRLYEEMSDFQVKLLDSREEIGVLRDELNRANLEKERIEQESAMWRSQLFERMEMLDKTKAKLAEVSLELEDMKNRAAYATESHKTSHQELQRRDREKQVFELKIEELQIAQKEVKDQAGDLLSALTDAERAIESLQRSNDFYQREIVGLKSIGASLTEQLTQLTLQRDGYKERLNTRVSELRAEKAESAHLLTEIERLKDELYETRSKLVTFQIESEVREIRKAGEEKSARAVEEKYSDFPTSESSVLKPEERSLLSRASKKVSGWFRLSDDTKVSRN